MTKDRASAASNIIALHKHYQAEIARLKRDNRDLRVCLDFLQGKTVLGIARKRGLMVVEVEMVLRQQGIK